jgi:SAM-dependent methyltransferase
MPAAAGPDNPNPSPQPPPQRAAHWEGVHAAKGAGEVSWWQEPDSLWLDLIEHAGVSPTDPVVDVGAGASMLVDALLEAGFTDVTVLDISASALDRVARRLGERAADVRLVAGDVTEFRAERPYVLWHDRAVFHFLTDPADRRAYRESLRANLAPGGLAVIAVFAPDGPENCSGLPVRRYDVPGLAREIGPGFTLVHGERRVHTTPWGAEQPFTVALLRRD